jgi:hypothetical protein
MRGMGEDLEDSEGGAGLDRRPAGQQQRPRSSVECFVFSDESERIIWWAQAYTLPSDCFNWISCP